MQNKIIIAIILLFSIIVGVISINVLPEFPKIDAEDFIYDESTLTKIAAARTALGELSVLLDKDTPLPGKEKTETAGDFLPKLSLLLDELPADSSDEFLYDRTFHNLVQDARKVIIELGYYFPDPKGTNFF